VSNNLWTYVQQHVVFGNIEKEEEAQKAAKLEKRAQNAPKPGAKPASKAAPSKPKPGAKPAAKTPDKINPAAKNAVANSAKESTDGESVDLSKSSSNGSVTAGSDGTKKTPTPPKAGGSPGSNGAKKSPSGRPASGPGGQRGGNQQRRKKRR
jgi:YidC/Oxa1 family membrane protein insertase